MQKELKSRSIIKTVSWRVWATMTTILLVYSFTGRFDLAFGIGGIEAVSKMFLYFLHERIWNRIKFGRYEVKPAVIWLTGLSGSGKSTIGRAVYDRLREQGFKVEYLDGDTIRDLVPGTGFTKEERDLHIKRVGYLASRLESQGIFVVASFVSPFSEARDFVRKLCRNFIEVHVSTPLEECERRDVKGLYAKARRGEIKNFTGLDSPYEIPTQPALRLNTAEIDVNEAANRVIAAALTEK
jgi:adenylylsulfate kinase